MRSGMTRQDGHSPRLPVDCLVVLLLIAALPFQDHATPLMGYSIVKWAFAVVAVLTLFTRGQTMLSMASHPVFLSLWIIIALGGVLETLHGGSLVEVRRITEMAGGAVVIASLCRSPKGVRFALTSYVIGGALVAGLLGFYYYGSVAGIGAGDFNEASQIRDAAFAESTFVIAPNAAGFMAAQGVVIAFMYLLGGAKASRKLFWGVLAIAGVFGVFLSMSRGAAAVIAMGTSIAVFRGDSGKLKVAVTVLSLAIIGYSIAPQAALSRISDFSAEHDVHSLDGGQKESRVKVYEASFQHLQDYWAVGIGADNFWKDWAVAAGFPVHDRVGVIGSHNVFLQTTIYWGIAALLPLIGLAGQLVAVALRGRKGDPTAVCVAMLAASLIVWMMLQHSLFAKEFTIGLGVIVAFDRLRMAQQPSYASRLALSGRRLLALRAAPVQS